MVVALAQGPLHVSCLPAGSRILAASLFLAADRPDRLEVEASFSALNAALPPWRPAAGIAAGLEYRGVRLFDGLIERAGSRRTPGGAAVFFIAYARYESRRKSRPETYRYMTDAEIAARIAEELGLAARTDPAPVVHERVERTGDPLRFLRSRARALGYELAVSAGTLHFRRRIEPVLRRRVAVVPESAIEEMRFEVDARGVRRGTLTCSADPSWAPLQAVELERCGSSWDGSYRVLRVRHLFSLRGARTVIEFTGGPLDGDGYTAEDGRP